MVKPTKQAFYEAYKIQLGVRDERKKNLLTRAQSLVNFLAEHEYITKDGTLQIFIDVKRGQVVQVQRGRQDFI